MICFLIVYIFFLDEYSEYNARHHTLFVYTLCKVFDNIGYQMDLFLLLTHVNFDLSKYRSTIPGPVVNEQELIVNIISGLTKLVKFEKRNYQNFN